MLIGDTQRPFLLTPAFFLLLSLLKAKKSISLHYPVSIIAPHCSALVQILTYGEETQAELVAWFSLHNCLGFSSVSLLRNNGKEMERVIL